MYGRRVHEAVLASGDATSGATVHLVSEEYDQGEIMAHGTVPVLPDDAPDTLAARVLAVGRKLLEATVLAMSRAGLNEPIRTEAGVICVLRPPSPASQI